MFEYYICNRPDEDVFYKQCAALEKRIPNIVRKRLLRDVDDSQIQFYDVNREEISVHLDNYIGGVFIKSKIDLYKFFPK